MTTALDVKNLTVAYRRENVADAVVTDVVVKGVDLRLQKGQILGLAGESGCGKSTTALAAIGFPIPGSVRLSGRATLGNIDLLSLPLSRLRRIWGRDVSHVGQDATRALDPLQRVDRILSEPLEIHMNMQGTRLKARAVELLQSVGISDPELALRRYPHQFSGGQQQRIALAVAMACAPEVLILDEPTSGLDVTTQAQVFRLIVQLVRNHGTATVLVSHDLALLATICDEIAIMYAGEIVERAPADSVYWLPRHPYTAALIDSVPLIEEGGLIASIPGLPPGNVIEDSCSFFDRCRFGKESCQEQHPPLIAAEPGHHVRCIRMAELGPISSQRKALSLDRAANATEPLLVVRNLYCSYRGRQQVIAVEDVSLQVAPGETLGVVGESGSGKSTLLRSIAGLHAPERGSIEFEGKPLPARAVKRSRYLRRAVQIVFQDPNSSLNPRHTIRTILGRPVSLFRPDLGKDDRREEVERLLTDVRLDTSVLGRYPHELSGGQKQRVALARAFAAQPGLILCDEVVSALDVSVQAYILELLARLASERGTALIFVTHNLAVVRSIADRICVMRAGGICDTGTVERIFETSDHPYTRELLAAVPRPKAAADGFGFTRISTFP